MKSLSIIGKEIKGDDHDMISRTIDYVDYNGVERRDTFYFHLNKADLWKLQIGKNGQFDKYMQTLMDSNDNAQIWNTMEEVLHMCVGKKSADGRKFDRSPAAKSDFFDTEAYSEFIQMLMTGNNGKDPNYAADFFNGLISTASGNAPINNDKAKEEN